ncbi:hypothetical protein H4R19_004745, partial [Coemansia spiralis]
MDTSAGLRPGSAAPRGGDGSTSTQQLHDGATFIVNPAGSAGGDGEMRQRPPVSAAGFNHMFSPLTIEQMFLHNPSRDTGSNMGASASIAGMLWHNSSSGGGDGSIGSAGDTLRQLLSNGSNPAQQGLQQPQQYPGQHMEPMPETDNGPHIAPYSPPDTIGSGGSIHDHALPRLAAAVVSGLGALSPDMARSPPPHRELSHRRSAQLEPRRIPLIQNQPQLRPSSQASMASLGTVSVAHLQRRDDAVPSHPRPLPMQPTARVMHRPAPMSAGEQTDYYSQPLQIHSAMGPGPSGRQLADLSLRHEVLDKVARRSHPTTPHDALIPVPSGQRPTSMMYGPSGVGVGGYSYPYSAEPGSDITMLPGDSRARAYVWDSGVGSGQPRGGALQVDTHQSGSLSRVGSLKRADYPGIGQARKASDSSAQLLTPKDFNGSLPDRIGDMVLNKELGEWVNINDYARASQTGSPEARGGQVQLPDAPARVESRGPSSKRSSISIHSHMSAFPLPLPTNRPEPGQYGIGLISPVENQRKQ